MWSITLRKVFISWRWLGVVLALIAATYIQICGSATMKELSGGLVKWRARMAEKKWARNIYSEGSKGVKYLKVTGNVTTYMDGSKVYSVQCHVDTSKEGYTSHITWVAGLLFSWHQTKDDVKKLIAGSFDIRQDTYGYQNIQWVPRTNFKNFPILQSSIDEHSAWLTLKRKTDFNKDKFVLNLPVNECEKITGVFECEIFGHPKKGGQYLHASDFFSFSDGDNSLDMKCAENKKRKTAKEIKAIADFSEKKVRLTLEEDHRTITEDARFETLRMGWNKKSQLKRRAKWVHVKAKLIKGKGHTVLELTGRVSEKHREQVTAITRIYMFYEPRNKGLSSVQYLVVGLVRDEAMWAEPFNLRNFPLLQRAIKDNNATGVSGSGHEAKFIVRIKYEDCETLPGKFFFEVIGTVRKAKSVIEGFYEIPNDSHLSRIPRSCLYRKPKPEKDEDKGRNGADRGKDKIANKVDYKDKMDTFKDTYNAKVRNLGKVVSKIKTRNRDKVEVEKAKPETESSNNTLLVVAIVILCVVIVVVAGFFIMKARKKQEGEESRPILNKTDENAEDISISDDEKKAKKKRKKKKRRDGEQKSKERKENEEPEEEKIQEEERKDEESKNNSNVYYQYKRPIRHRQSYVVPPDYVRSRDVQHKYTKTPSYMRYSYPQQTYRGPQNLVPATSLTQYAGTSSYDHCMAQQSVRHNYIPVNDYRSYDDIFRPSMYVDHEVDLTQSRPVPQPTYVTPRHRVSHTRPIMSDHQYPKNFTNGVKGGHPSQHEGRTAGDPVYGQSSQQRDLIQLHTDGQKSNERKNVAASTAELAVPKNTPEINEHNDNEQKPCVSEQVMDSELHGDTSLPENVDPNLLSTLVKRRLSFAPSSASTNIQDLDKNSVTSDNSKSKSATE